MEVIREFNDNEDIYKDEMRECKIINDFMAELPEQSYQTIELQDLERQFRKYQQKFEDKFETLEKFVNQVKQEKSQKDAFIFTEIPEYIISKKMLRKDYDEVIKVLKKVRLLYLANKLDLKGEDPNFENAVLTDDDMVPCNLFDKILSDIKHKYEEKRQTIQKFLEDMKKHIDDIIAKMRVESEKTKRIIEQSVLVTSINDRMENKNRKIFKNQFVFRNLYTALVKNSTIFT